MAEERVIEICCAGADDVAAAVEGGASRIELCSVLSAEGVTPSPGLIDVARSIAGNVAITVLVRPREGNFCYTAREVDVMVEDVRTIVAAGAQGVTIGALDEAGMPDRKALERLIKAAEGKAELTFHRAIDMCPDPVAAIDILSDLGFDRVLTSGGAPTAMEGVPTLRRMMERAADRLVIMPGGGVRPDNIAKIHSLTGATQFHSSARHKADATGQDNKIFGATLATVDSDIVRQLIKNSI
ncbi:MAG: copper homeostasis protein CutC [Muribaculaceae bacterium]|nr:copper homeostasis protein CutC [Muribaculaceae bacterium]